MKAPLTTDLISPEVNFRDTVIRQKQGTAEVRGTGRKGGWGMIAIFLCNPVTKAWYFFSGQHYMLKLYWEQISC